jgi:hypothetical protein
MVDKNLFDGLKQKPTSHDMVVTIANMQGKIDEYESFVNWAIDFVSFKRDNKKEFNDVKLMYLEDVIRQKFTNKYENTSTW